MKQEMIGWQWHQLDHIQIICTLLQADNHARALHHSIFYRPNGLPDTQQTVSKHWRQITTTIMITETSLRCSKSAITS